MKSRETHDKARRIVSKGKPDFVRNLKASADMLFFFGIADIFLLVPYHLFFSSSSDDFQVLSEIILGVSGLAIAWLLKREACLIQYAKHLQKKDKRDALAG